jgi:hypothetical protein
MADLGDFLDMFNNGDDDEKTKSRKLKSDGTEEQQPGSDIKSMLVNKITKNKVALIGVIAGGVVIVGAIAFIAIKYLGANGIKNIIDGIQPLTG